MNNFSQRLRFVGDQCPLPTSKIPSVHHTHWYAEAHTDEQHRLWQTDGWTNIVLKNKLITWYRSFTLTPPHLPSTSSFVTINEWLPRFQPATSNGWKVFGRSYTAAYARLHDRYHNDWNNQAKRHLKNFKRTGCSLRLGTRHDVTSLYASSQVPKTIRLAMLKMLDKHLLAHPETIDILVAETAGQAIACFVVGNCDEAGVSEYLIGAFDPAFKNLNAMVGLIDWWYKRSLELEYAWVTFGYIEPPTRFRLHDGDGYSLFKTNFGVTRLWFPKNRWQIKFKHRSIFSQS